MSRTFCIVGCGAIGSLYAAHLARVAEVHAFVRRPEHARALHEHGLRVSGLRDFTSRLHATCEPAAVPRCEFAIVAAKATQTSEAFGPLAHIFRDAIVLSAQNGLGCEEIIAGFGCRRVLRGTTFMSGSRLSDWHVKMELDTPTWLGPFEPTATPFSDAQQLAALIRDAGLKAEALPDARPAQWSKLIFNASVNAVAALTGLPHCREFAQEKEFPDLGRLLHDLMDEGRRVAAALGVELHEDPWEMNRIGAATDHPPSMLHDVLHRQTTEAEFLGGAIAREAARLGVPAPLHTALYRLIKGREASWRR
jgi:2-dehydropantoate 2-reductase